MAILAGVLCYLDYFIAWAYVSYEHFKYRHNLRAMHKFVKCDMCENEAVSKVNNEPICGLHLLTSQKTPFS